MSTDCARSTSSTPERLRGYAAEIYNEYVVEMAQNSICVDMRMLEEYCFVTGKIREIDLQLNEEGLTVINELGRRVANPLCDIRKGLVSAQKNYQENCGLGALIRLRVQRLQTDINNVNRRGSARKRILDSLR